MPTHRHLKFPLALLMLAALLLVPATRAEQTQTQETAASLDMAELDSLLAPIALYPDTLLSHVLIAASYPLEVIQAARWREKHPDLDAAEILESVEDQDWDPSVKALLPFKDLLQKMSEDLTWTQDLGEAFLADEEQVLARIQVLRERAYEQGNLSSNSQVVVEKEPDVIRIETVRRETVYVPYYDTRIVYGDWWWHNSPHYWSHPHYYGVSGVYWGPSIWVRPYFYFSALHWTNRHVVINRTFYHQRPYQYPRRYWYRDVGDRWHHDIKHRRGVRYHHPVAHRKVTVNREYQGGKPYSPPRVTIDRGAQLDKAVRDPSRYKSPSLERKHQHERVRERIQSLNKHEPDRRLNNNMGRIQKEQRKMDPRRTPDIIVKPARVESAGKEPLRSRSAVQQPARVENRQVHRAQPQKSVQPTRPVQQRARTVERTVKAERQHQPAGKIGAERVQRH
ncbi:DUF3300 domain-containing protein [Bowmanella dokdonensis]|uniref:DUF3300 domain-containing protein n=1 Tax=Bowmanella dokdonensis TaxID=751969 RepID=A0A939DSM2_9ALTE|nr:DUF3300 domain-containing protein [Bowmanella dokdonensis]MBN7827196.1 DUF3300 domain-containing protein [Bowmanella dokdonensis]